MKNSTINRIIKKKFALNNLTGLEEKKDVDLRTL